MDKNVKIRTVYLTPPRVSANHCKERITCIRGHRERTFQIALQHVGNKIVIHNYGQGGAGFTFLLGSVGHALRLFRQENVPSTKSIVVVGAGCYGLLTAIHLARAGYNVRIVASEYESLSSYKAAGFFFPRPRKMATEQERSFFYHIGRESYKEYLSISLGSHDFLSKGASLISAYYGMDIDPGFGPYITDGLIQEPECVLVDFKNGMHFQAYEYNTIFIDTTALMHELMTQVDALGIERSVMHLNSLEEISETIIFNCSGLGARTLAYDNRIVPVQGHLILLEYQPPREELRYMINVKVVQPYKEGFRDELIYYAPKGNGIIGITFKRGEESLTSNSYEFDRLIERCQKFFGCQDVHNIMQENEVHW